MNKPRMPTDARRARVLRPLRDLDHRQLAVASGGTSCSTGSHYGGAVITTGGSTTQK